jgi:hypothetical protein
MVAACLLAFARDAKAEGGLLNNAFGIPRAEDGRGLKVGQRSTFHAGFALGTGYDSNVYSNAKKEKPVDSAFLWPSAWIGIGNRELRDSMLMSPPERSGRWLDYNVSVLSGFRQYLARDADTRSVPKFSIGAQLRLVFLPGRRFSAELNNDFFRGAYAGTFQTDGRQFNFNRIDERGQLNFYLRPGGGRLSFGLGYRLQLLRFENGNLNRGNRTVNGLFHETKWRFLPRSSVLVQYTVDFTYYECCPNPGNGRKEDNWAHRLMAGYRGQVVEKLALEALAGWGGARYYQDSGRPRDPSWKLNTFIGRVAINYFPTMRSLVHVSFFRDFQDSLFGNYFVDTGGRFALGHQFRWRMIGHLGASLAARRYHGLPVLHDDPNNLPNEDSRINSYRGPRADRYQRDTVIVGLAAKLEQPLGKIFALSLGYNMYADTRAFEVEYFVQNPGPMQPNTITDDIHFIKHIVMLVAAVRI